MKPIAVLTMAILIGMTAASTSTAESRHGKGHKGGFWAELELTAEQQDQIKQLRERMGAHKEQFKERGERPSKEEMEALKLEYDQALAAILTPEQQDRLKEMKASGKGRGPGGGKGRGHRRGHPIMHALKKLDLSDAQWASVKELFAARKADMEQRKAAGERPTREEMRVQREQMKEAIAAILTPEQQQQLEGLRAARGKGGERDADMRTIENVLIFDEVPPTVTESKSWGEIKAESKQD